MPDDIATLAKTLGITLDAKSATALQTQIDVCNGKRKKLRLSYSDALQTALDAAGDPNGIAVRHAGAELLARTTLCLAVKTPNGIVVGVQGLFADKPTPGRAWKDVQPWKSDFAKNVEKAQAWAKKSNKDRVTVKLGKATKAAAPAGDGAKLLAAILADPDDDQARAVYADHLTDAGDPRGELITIQLQLRGKLTPAKKGALTKRERELIKKHGRTWSKEATQFGDNYKLDRGFIGTVEMTGANWASHGAKLLAKEPITTLSITKVTAPGLLAVANAPHTARLRRIEMWDALWLKRPQDAAAINAFLRSKHVGAVRELQLRVSRERSYMVQRDPVDLSELYANVTLPAVETLELFIGQVPDSALASLATISAPKLRELVVGASKAKQKTQLAALKKKFPKATVS